MYAICMNLLLYIPKIQLYLLRFLQLQLFLTLISLPFLIAWGLPLSLLSPVGNLIFSPFLSLFLLLSSLLFFTELLHIPNTWFAWALDILTSVWLWLLDWYSQSCLIGFAKPSIWLLFIIPCTAIYVVLHSKIETAKYLSIVFTLLLAGFYIVLQMHAQYKPILHQIPCNGGTITIAHDNKQTIIIDPGVIGKSASACSWVQYTLMPYIIQLTGSLHIDHVVMLQPSMRTFEAITTLCKNMKIQYVYLPWWHGTLSKSAWRTFFQMREAVHKQHGTIKHLGAHATHIVLSADSMVHIEPTTYTGTYQEATFPIFHVYGTIDKESFEFYSAKHKMNSQKSEIL